MSVEVTMKRALNYPFILYASLLVFCLVSAKFWSYVSQNVLLLNTDTIFTACFDASLDKSKLKIFLYYFKWNHMKDGSLIIRGNWDIWKQRQVQVESIVTAALWCIRKHFPLSNRNRISKYFFTGMYEILALSNRSLTWTRWKLAVPICKFYLYLWKLSFLWAPQDRKTF